MAIRPGCLDDFTKLTGEMVSSAPAENGVLAYQNFISEEPSGAERESEVTVTAQPGNELEIPGDELVRAARPATVITMSDAPLPSMSWPHNHPKSGEVCLSGEEQARRLIESIDTSTVVGLRDRALIGVMTYAFARIGAVVAMRSRTTIQGKRWWVRLHEKGGKHHEMPAHHKLEAYIDEYLIGAGIARRQGSPLPHRARQNRRADRRADAPHRRLAYDPAPRGRGRDQAEDRLSCLPRNRHHGLSLSL